MMKKISNSSRRKHKIQISLRQGKWDDEQKKVLKEATKESKFLDPKWELPNLNVIKEKIKEYEGDSSKFTKYKDDEKLHKDRQKLLRLYRMVQMGIRVDDAEALNTLNKKYDENDRKIFHTIRMIEAFKMQSWSRIRKV